MSDTEESHPVVDPVVDETPVDAPASNTEDAPAAVAVASEEKKADIDKSDDDEDEAKPKPPAEGEESTEPAAPKPKKMKKQKQRATKVNSDGEEESYEEEVEVTDEEEEEEAPKAPPKRPPPARAPPAPPPKIYEVPSETWSSAPVSNRVWEVDEQEEYEAVPEQEELNLSESELATLYTLTPTSELGRGFFATVKTIVSKKNNTKYALKIIDKNNAPQFVNGGSELDILSRFNHPNIIKGEAVFTYENYLLVVLELAAGGEFASVVSKGAGSYTESDVHRFAKQLVSAVDHIHSNHVIHGDLAPENLFLVGDEKSELKVGGFSGALISTGEKQNQQLIGNAEYQAPEILTNQGFTQSADMWAVGCILFFFVTGSSPFKDSNSMRMNMKIRQGKFEYDDACWTAVSPSLKDLISKLLVTDAASRLSASAVLNHQWITSAPGNANLPNARKAMAL